MPHKNLSVPATSCRSARASCMYRMPPPAIAPDKLKPSLQSHRSTPERRSLKQNLWSNASGIRFGQASRTWNSEYGINFEYGNPSRPFTDSARSLSDLDVQSLGTQCQNGLSAEQYPEEPSIWHSIKDETGEPELRPELEKSTGEVSEEDLDMFSASHSPLGYHIPRERFRAARSAPLLSEGSYWSHTLYRGGLDGTSSVKVHYCKTRDAMENVCQLFQDDEILGFDIEWVANSRATDGIKRNVSLIQVANEERVALFHIARFIDAQIADELIPPIFKHIMESRRIIKTGVAIKGDCTRLRNFLGIDSRGLFELSHLYKLVKHCSGLPVKVNRWNVNLAEQAQQHLGLPLLKGDVQTSDWTRDLDFNQTRYAASDSYACFQLFHVMEAKRLAFTPVPPRPAFAELNQTIRLTDEQECTVEDTPLIANELDESSECSSESYTGSDASEDDLPSLSQIMAEASLQDSTKPEARTKRERAAKITPPQPAIKSFTPSSTQLEQANEWTAAYKAEDVSKGRIAPQSLRAYHLWYHQEYEVAQVAAYLREPPLKESTVVDYICGAIFYGSLPADPERVALLEHRSLHGNRVAHRKILTCAPKEVEKRKKTARSGAERSNVGWWRSWY